MFPEFRIIFYNLCMQGDTHCFFKVWVKVLNFFGNVKSAEKVLKKSSKIAKSTLKYKVFGALRRKFRKMLKKCGKTPIFQQFFANKNTAADEVAGFFRSECESRLGP